MPLKKRRVVLVSELYGFSLLNRPNDDNNDCRDEDRKMMACCASFPSGTGTFSKMNALSIIAAAASAKEAAAAAQQQQQPDGADKERFNSSTSSSSEDEDENGSDHHQPFPGCCHAKTSRNNSYCQRQPCYSGSTFCKLHYQQPQEQQDLNTNLAPSPVAATMAATAPSRPITSSSSISSSSSSAAPMVAQAAAVTTTTSVTALTTTTSNSTTAAAAAAGGQDKRYMGQELEVRCLATTTRGRACAYTAVHDTRYCFLHADYDTNPPPRRKSKEEVEAAAALVATGNTATAFSITAVASSTPATAAAVSPPLKKKKQKVAVLRAPSPVIPKKAKTLVIPAKAKPLAIPIKKAKTCVTPNKKAKTLAIPPSKEAAAAAAAVANFKKRFRRTSAKLAEKHAGSPHPLLSMIATDKWLGKTVKIAMGQLEGRTGVVEKWGNGWVSVNIKGVGLHNRRSFELYLDEPGHEGDDNDEVARNEDHKLPPVQQPQPDEHDQNLQLFRCVSRDVVSPSPSTDSSAKSRSGGRAVTPKVSRSSPLPLLEGLVSPRDNRFKMAAATTTGHELLPGTPRPVFLREMVSDGAETPVQSKATVEAFRKLPASEVTPFFEKPMAMPPHHDMKGESSSSLTSFDLQLPDASDKRVSVGMVFRPSMGERTRGRTGSNSGEDDAGTAAATSTVLPKKRSHIYLEENYSYSS